MQNLQTQNELLEAKYFQVEELEERLENGWRTCYCPKIVTNAAGDTSTIYIECECPSHPIP